MGNLCVGRPKLNSRTEIILNPKISKFTKRIISYYIFHKRIEEVFNFIKNQMDEYDNYINHDEFKNIKLYILDDDWIQYWKACAEYNSIKEELDKLHNPNNPKNIKNLERSCQNFINIHSIVEYNSQFNNNENEFNKFISNNNLSLENFDDLIDEKTYDLFNKSFKNPSNNDKKIKGIITRKIIILFISQFQLIKFILNSNDELIQLTAHCLELDDKTHEFDLEKSKIKYEAFKNYILNQNNEIVNILQGYNFDLNQEIFITLDEFIIKIKNETFCNKNQNIPSLLTNKINFQNINQMRLVGLDNVGATCYMNATLQCFLNLNSLTVYLLNEQIFNKINEDISLYALSASYCNLLVKVWLDSKVTSHYAPYDFKRVISAKNPLFEGINANDSKDLINFLLEEMNFELSRLNVLYQNQINYQKDLQNLDQEKMEMVLENFRKEFSRKNNSIIAQNFFFILQTNTLSDGCRIVK